VFLFYQKINAEKTLGMPFVAITVEEKFHLRELFDKKNFLQGNSKSL
jgi:hypothetical protein